MVLLKEFFEKVDFEKNQQTTKKKIMKNFAGGKELRSNWFSFPKNIVFPSLKIFILLANSADPDEMPHFVAFHQGLHCLRKVPI